MQIGFAAFIRKLRGSGITEDSRKSLLVDVADLNLSKHISEDVTTVSECNLYSSDTDWCGIAPEIRGEQISQRLSSPTNRILAKTSGLDVVI